jgi:hypothetical protein
VVDPQLQDAVANGLHVAGIAEAQAPQPHLDPCLGPAIPKPVEPAIKRRALDHLDHVSTLLIR